MNNYNDTVPDKSKQFVNRRTRPYRRSAQSGGRRKVVISAGVVSYLAGLGRAVGMSLSLVSVAMHLSGLEAAHFTGDQKLRWLYEDGARRLHAASPALSTASNASSSGFNSWASDNQKEDVTLTADTAREDTAKLESKPEPVKAKEIVMHEGRDILDLGSNLGDPSWDLRPSELPKDPQNFFLNRSQYSRVQEDPVPLHVDVPCEFCDFVISYYD